MRVWNLLIPNNRIKKYTLLFLLSVIFSCLVYLYTTISEHKEVKNIGKNYQFLMFPKGNAVLYDLYGNTLGNLQRAVLTSHGELLTGRVSVKLVDEKIGYIQTSSLLYTVSNPKALLNVLFSELPINGLSKIAYSSHFDNGEYLVSFTLTDNQHARSETYTYTTAGNSIKKVFSAKFRNTLFYLYYIAITLALFSVLIIAIRLYTYFSKAIKISVNKSSWGNQPG